MCDSSCIPFISVGFGGKRLFTVSRSAGFILTCSCPAGQQADGNCPQFFIAPNKNPFASFELKGFVCRKHTHNSL